MYLGASDLTYREHVALVQGLSYGHPGLLTGFQEFLVLKLDDGDNLGWPTLVKRIALSAAAPVDASADEQATIDAAFNLLDEFLAETRGTDASAILREHLLWKQRQPWYDVDLLRFSRSPAPRQYELTEAAAELGVEPRQIYELMADAKVQPSRSGQTLFLSLRQIESLEVHLKLAPDPVEGD